MLIALAGAMPASAQTTDSRVIENLRPSWTPSEQLRLSTSPTLVIGLRAGAEYEFGRIAGAARFTDGRIAVGDGSTTQVRFFDSRGTFLSALGRKGQGPGELPGLSMMQWLPGDVLAVGSAEVVSLFSSAGKLIGRIDLYHAPLPMAEGEKRIVAVLPDGKALVGNIRQWRQTGHPPKTGLRWTDSVHLVVLGPANRLTATLGNFPARVMEWGKDYDLFSPAFAPSGSYASNASRLYIGFGAEYIIRVFTAAGRPEFTINRQWTPRRVDGVTLPAYNRMLADRSGNLWVRAENTPQAAARASSPSHWSVFSAEGRWLGDVSMPGRFIPTDIGPGYVLGVSRDADDVESVALYGLSQK